MTAFVARAAAALGDLSAFRTQIEALVSVPQDPTSILVRLNDLGEELEAHGHPDTPRPVGGSGSVGCPDSRAGSDDPLPSNDRGGPR